MMDNKSEGETPKTKSGRRHVKLLSPFGGHKDWTMIARVYRKWIKDAQPEAGNKAVAMFASTGKILSAA